MKKMLIFDANAQLPIAQARLSYHFQKTQGSWKLLFFKYANTFFKLKTYIAKKKKVKRPLSKKLVLNWTKAAKKFKKTFPLV